MISDFTLMRLPFKLSLYIGLPSLALIYYFLKRTKNETKNDEFNYENVIKSRQAIVDLKVPAECVRTIIGPQGATIKEIQRKTNTRISFKDKGNTLDDPNVEHIIVIRGSNINAQLAEIEIKKLILDMAMQLTEEYFVPDYACGRIIGRGGASIKEISMISNCKIKLREKVNSAVLNNPSVTDLTLIDDTNIVQRKVISLTGSFEQIAHAKYQSNGRSAEADQIPNPFRNYDLKELIITKIKETELLQRKSKPNIGKSSNFINNNRSYETGSTSNLPKMSNQNNDSLSDRSSPKPAEKLAPLPPIMDLEAYLDADQSVDVFVSAIANPHAFWVQVISEDSLKLDLLSDEMQTFYEQNMDDFTFVKKEEI